MRAKKDSRRAAIKYLLSLDRSLGRATLKRIVERVKPTKQRASRGTSKMGGDTARRARASRPALASAAGPATARRHVAAGFRRKERNRRSLDRRPLVIATVCVLAAAAVIAARWPSTPDRIVQIEDLGQIDQIETAASFVPETDAAQPEITSASTRTSASPASATSAAAPASNIASPPLATKQLTPPSQSDAVASASATATTITGCLERDDEKFRLTDTSGDDAPRSRSWKSGFITKRSASVELIDAKHIFRLPLHVGQRVETTGILTDRAMRLQSLRVHGSCD